MDREAQRRASRGFPAFKVEFLQAYFSMESTYELIVDWSLFRQKDECVRDFCDRALATFNWYSSMFPLPDARADLMQELRDSMTAIQEAAGVLVVPNQLLAQHEAAMAALQGGSVSDGADTVLDDISAKVSWRASRPPRCANWSVATTRFTRPSGHFSSS